MGSVDDRLASPACLFRSLSFSIDRTINFSVNLDQSPGNKGPHILFLGTHFRCFTDPDGVLLIVHSCMDLEFE